MKNWIISIVVISFGTMQSQKKLDALKIPSSPAASILGMQPSSILQPKSYRALEAALFTNFSDENGNSVIPNDFGLEFAPYWATDHGTSLTEQLFPKTFLDKFYRNLSFSLASTQNFILQDSTKTKSISFGVRSSLYFGNSTDIETIQNYTDNLSRIQKVSAKAVSDIQGPKFETKQDLLTAIHDKLINRIYEVYGKKSKQDAAKIVENIYKAADSLAYDKDDQDSFIIAFSSIIDTEMKNSYEEFKKYILDRQGLHIDFAYALSLNFPTNDFNYSAAPRQSVWINPTYKFSDKISFLKAIGVLRYEWYNKKYFENYFPDAKVYKNNYDYGLALLGEFKKFSIEFEATGRKSSSLSTAGTDGSGNTLYTKETASDFQYIGTFSYRLTEQIALSYQIGSSFKPIFTTSGTLISLLSLNFGFGGPNTTDVTSKN